MVESLRVASNLLSAMSHFIAGMTAHRDWRLELAELMPRLGAELDLSRVALYVVHMSEDAGLGVTCAIDWARADLRSLSDNTHPPVRPGEADALQREWAERRTRGEVIAGRTKDLVGYLGAYFRAASIVSFYTVPVMVNGTWWGHFCVSSDDPERVWSADERAAFGALAELIALAVEPSRAGGALSEASRQAMLVAALDAIVTIDEAGQIVDFNPSAEAMFGFAREAVIGRYLNETIIPQHYRHAHETGMIRYMSGAEPHILGQRIEIEARASDGRVFPIELTVTEIRTDRRRLFIAYLRDISERIRAKKELERLAYTDAVTGLANRPGVSRLIRTEGHSPHGVLVIRLPDLATLSASFGEEFIRPLVVAMADRLRAHLPEAAQLARTGESEFAIVLMKDVKPDMLGAQMESLLHTALEIEGRRFYLHTGIGIATGPGELEQLLRDAELAAQSCGSAHWSVFDESLRAEHQYSLELEAALREAVMARSDDIHPVFQPIVDCHTGAVAGFEALARWNHPGLGLIAPAEFIPLAEAVGLIDPLGDLILERAVEACARWNEEAREGSPLYVSVNLSAPQLAAPDLIQRLDDILSRHRVAGGALCLELTESTLVAQPAMAASRIQQLKTLGCSVAIDDFGTGYSSFSYLQHLPADVLKIDRSFMHDLPHEPRASKIVAVMVELAHALGMSVVAEGVETAQTMRAVEELGCDFVQGYLTGRPITLDDTLALARAATRT